MLEQRFVEMIASATSKTLEGMAMTKISLTGSAIKNGNELSGDVTGIIGLAGDLASGTTAISFSKQTILFVFENMFGETLTEIDDQILDAVGEMTNMICGDFKRQLSDHEIVVGMATPLVITGAEVRIRDRISRAPTVLSFKTEGGTFIVESNFEVLS